VLPLALSVFVIWAFVYFRRHPEPTRRARFVRTFALGIMASIGGFFAFFVIGETLADPGGWRGVALVATWAVPLAALTTFGWTRPDLARPVFVLLTGAVVVMSSLFALDRNQWSSFEDRNGPVRAIATFALLVALSFYACKRPRSGGCLMLIVSVVPLVVSAGSPGFAAMAILNSTSALSAVLFLWSASLERQIGTGKPSQDEPGTPHAGRAEVVTP